MDAGETVYSKNENASNIYFIVKGRVNFVFGHRRIVYSSVSVGGYFGDISLCHNIRRESNVETSIKSKFLVLSKEISTIIKSDYP